jgi:hypothetical protein
MTSSSVEYVTGSHLAGEVVDTAIGLISPAGVLKFANIFKKTCFTAGTQVVVGTEYNGEGTGVEYVTVNIEDIKVGDLVYSYDTVTGEVSQKEVTDTFVRTSNHINYLTIIDENGHEQVIETTDSHPFWVITNNPDLDRAAREIIDEDGTILYHENIGVTEQGYWVEAKDLREGDVFLGANGELSLLTNRERVEFPEGITVYNFTVDGNHDYFVIAQEYEFGQTCILVHNAGYGRRGSQAHRDEIARVQQIYESKNWIVESGGNGPEVRTIIDEATRTYRYADLVMSKGGKTIAIQVGRVDKKGNMIPREADAFNDLLNSRQFDYVEFWQYN